MSKMAFTFDLEQANEYAKVVISLPTESGRDEIVTGIVTQDFSVTGSANYVSPFESSAVENLSQYVQNLQAFIANVGVEEFSNAVIPTLKVIEQTVSVWSSTEVYSFSLPMLFVALRENDNVLRKVLALQRAVYPTVAALPTERAHSLIPPLGYVPTPAKRGAPAKNTVSLSIGSWFRAHSLLITSVNFSLSKEVIANGSPLFATGDVSFRSYRLLDYDEFRSFFKTA